MNIVKIKEFISLRRDLKESGVIGISVWGDDIQLRISEMVKLPTFHVVLNYDSEYPYRALAEINGVRFYSIFNEKSFEEYPVLKSLVPMVEDVDLSGMPDIEVNESA